MSINIKTSSGLQKLTPEVNKSTISSALGYTPTDDTKLNEHAADSTIHVTSEEKAKWNNKSNFNGDYNSLTNKPEIPVLPEWTDDVYTNEQGSFAIVDESGNIAFEVANDGTTRVAALEINNKDFAAAVNEAVIIPEVKLPEWIDSVIDNGEGTFTIIDEAGNKSFEIRGDGATNVAHLEVAGTEINKLVDNKINALVDGAGPELDTLKELSEALGNDENFSTTVLNKISTTDAKVEAIGAKADATDAKLVNIVDDESNQFNITDKDGNIALQITENGTTRVAALEIDGKDFSTIVNEVVRIPEVNIPDETDPTVSDWAKKEYSGDILTAIGAMSASEVIPTKVSELENDKNYLTEYTETDPTVPAWAKQENKPTYTAEEVGLGDIVADEQGSFILVDTDGKKSFEVTPEGITNVAKLVVNGIDIENMFGSYVTDLTAIIGEGF